MPPSRYLFLLAAVLAAGGATVLLGAAIAPRLPEGAAPWVILSTLAAAAAVALLGRRR
jgi:hypothetical protein